MSLHRFNAFLADSQITSFNAVSIGATDISEITEDKALVTLTFADGSIGTINYLTNGGKAFGRTY